MASGIKYCSIRIIRSPRSSRPSMQCARLTTCSKGLRCRGSTWTKWSRCSSATRSTCWESGDEMLRFLFLFAALPVFAQQMRLDLAERLGPLQIDHMALGQGGLSEQPMWDDRVNEVRMLHPRMVRLFIQEYFDLMPAPGKYH